MVGKPQSLALKKQLAHEEKDALEKEAVKQYKEEQSRMVDEGERHKGARKICEEVSFQHYKDTRH